MLHATPLLAARSIAGLYARSLGPRYPKSGMASRGSPLDRDAQEMSSLLSVHQTQASSPCRICSNARLSATPPGPNACGPTHGVTCATRIPRIERGSLILVDRAQPRARNHVDASQQYSAN